MIATCPTCGAAGVPLLFGKPVEAARLAAADGELALGGCFMPDAGERPYWRCPQEHHWVDGTPDTWQARVLEALVRHGYDDPGAGAEPDDEPDDEPAR